MKVSKGKALVELMRARILANSNYTKVSDCRFDEYEKESYGFTFESRFPINDPGHMHHGEVAVNGFHYDMDEKHVYYMFENNGYSSGNLTWNEMNLLIKHDEELFLEPAG